MKKLTFSILAVLAFMLATFLASAEQWNVRVVGGSGLSEEDLAEELLMQEPQLIQLQGIYNIVGSNLDQDKAYAGTATISVRGSKFLVTRTIEGREIESEGRFEIPQFKNREWDPKKDGKKLLFDWEDGKGLEASSYCWYHDDADVTARITCLWNSKQGINGIEAMFPKR